MTEEATKKRKRELMDSLDFPQRSFRRYAISTHVTGTCAWLLELPQYLAWLDDSLLHEHHGLLWIKGNPGSGKSTLVKFALDEHKARVAAERGQHSETILISFFFNARGEDLEHNVTGMYRSLLLDLLRAQPDLEELVLDADQVPHMAIRIAGLPILKKLFTLAVERATKGKRLICYIDALDECDREDINSLMVSLQDLARSLVGQSGRFRAFCSSRYYRNLEPDIGVVIKLDEVQAHKDDLDTYIDRRLCRDLKNLPGLCEILLQGARGSFLWAVLVVDILNDDCANGRRPHDTASLKQQLPKELDEVFIQIIKRDLVSPKRDARKHMEFQIAITWVLHAREPLGAYAFCEALDVGLAVELKEHMRIVSESEGLPEAILKRRIISATKGLVEVKSDEHCTVQFIHEAVRTFFLNQSFGSLLPDATLRAGPLSHETLKRYCLHCIDCFLKMTSSDRVEKNTFAAYAFEAILHHANSASSLILQRSFVEEFPEDEFIERSPQHVNLLYICAKYNLSALVASGGFDRKAKDIAYINSAGESCRSIAEVAAESGCVEIIQRLAAWGADLGRRHNAWDFPLRWAVQNRHEAVVDILIQSGVDLNQQEGWGATALFTAAKQGDVSMMKKLIKHGASVHRPRLGTVCVGTPLTAAASSKQRSMEAVKQLLDAGANPNMASNSGVTPLIIVHSVEACRLLLEAGANINTEYVAVQGSARRNKVISEHTTHN